MIESKGNIRSGASIFMAEAPIKVNMPDGKSLACPAGTQFSAYNQLVPDPERKSIGARMVVEVLLHEGDRETTESKASLLRKITRAEGRQRWKRTLARISHTVAE